MVTDPNDCYIKINHGGDRQLSILAESLNNYLSLISTEDDSSELLALIS